MLSALHSDLDKSLYYKELFTFKKRCTFPAGLWPAGNGTIIPAAALDLRLDPVPE
jgi:hypothetical protein